MVAGSSPARGAKFIRALCPIGQRAFCIFGLKLDHPTYSLIDDVQYTNISMSKLLEIERCALLGIFRNSLPCIEEDIIGPSVCVFGFNNFSCLLLTHLVSSTRDHLGLFYKKLAVIRDRYGFVLARTMIHGY